MIATAARIRPSFEEIYMRLAWAMSTRSTCRRLSVGCAITSLDFRQVFAVGYNGNATGLPNDCDTETPGLCGCIHAEENACINCTAPRNEMKVVFCTHLPCKMCAKRLVNLGGIVRVLYDKDYRLREGLDVLSAAGIKAIQLSVGSYGPERNFANTAEGGCECHQKSGQ